MVWLLATAVLCGTPTALRAETYDLYIYTYCPASTGVCGFGSYHAYWTYIRNTVQELNVQWETVGVSFRPAYIPIPVDDPDYVNAGCQDIPRTPEDEAALFDDWRQVIAQNNPKRISILLNYAAPGAGRMCCSQLPNNSGNP